ncbi:uncharacterized protein LOC135217108 [Macrobrachium nipponense]|uniref:uncharacterized protein LOC135217108 n=1 Tax=Macrobrachium nipponense TaxID=159736 RepID=UPI0030C87494
MMFLFITCLVFISEGMQDIKFWLQDPGASAKTSMKNVYVLCLLVACSVHAMPNVKNRIKAQDGAVRIPGRVHLPLKHRRVALLEEIDTKQNENLYKNLKFNGREVKRLVKPTENEDDGEDERATVKKNRSKRDVIPGLPEGFDLDINFDLDIPPKDLKRADIDFNIKVEALHPHRNKDGQ